VEEQTLAPVVSLAPSLPSRTLPVDYVEANYWRLASDWRRLVVANLMGLVLAPIATVGFGLYAVLVAGLSPENYFGLSGTFNQSGALTTAVLTVSLILTMVVHELTHGVTIRAVGNRPSYGFQWAGLVPYATAEGQFFKRNEFIAAALAPLVGLSVVGCLALLVVPAWAGPWVLFALIANAAGAAGDIWMSAIALQYPASAWIVDERDGMRIFVRSR
jgi:hypothetical protein